MRHIDQFGESLAAKTVDEHVCDLFFLWVSACFSLMLAFDRSLLCICSFPHVATRFFDTSSFLRKLTLKPMLVLAPTVSCTNFQCWSQAKIEKAMM